MRVMMRVSMPVQAGNKGIRDGSLPRTVMAFVEQHKPEASYFTADGGRRTAFFFFDLKEVTDIPRVAEPFLQELEADITMSPVMNLQDMQAGVARAMKG